MADPKPKRKVHEGERDQPSIRAKSKTGLGWEAKGRIEVQSREIQQTTQGSTTKRVMLVGNMAKTPAVAAGEPWEATACQEGSKTNPV